MMRLLKIKKKNTNTIFLFKSKNLLKNLSKFKKIKNIKKLNFLIFNTKKTINFLS